MTTSPSRDTVDRAFAVQGSSKRIYTQRPSWTQASKYTASAVPRTWAVIHGRSIHDSGRTRPTGRVNPLISFVWRIRGSRGVRGD